MIYGNSLFLANVEHMRKQRGEKVGEVENAVEVSTGYFARLSKNPNTLPGAEVLIKLALHFDISIDALLLYNLSAMSEEEEMIAKYIGKLRDGTAHGIINWKVENELLSARKLQLISAFPHKGDVFTNGATYISNLSDGSCVKIIPISGVDFAEERFGGFELMVKEANAVSWFPICATDLVSDMLKMDLKNLYMIIMSRRSQFSMDEGAKNYMLRFLAQDNGSQETV
ncbi:MAG: helix-turn-helix domain-containing protein [Lachnospiraceae bacterium]|nr:helix-turn-helix domain-containing protein [Lachnospiraceae bacterium]